MPIKENRAVFLDRDGVINRVNLRNGKPYPPASLLELEILPGVATALTALHEAGFLLIVVTNQPDVARGNTSKAEVEEINNYLTTNLPIDEIRTCFHDNCDGCNCRKPLPGSILEAAKIHNIDLSTSYMIGDRWRDIEAGQGAGCKTILIDYGFDEKKSESMNFCVQSLIEASQIILTTLPRNQHQQCHKHD